MKIKLNFLCSHCGLATVLGNRAQWGDCQLDVSGCSTVHGPGDLPSLHLVMPSTDSNICCLPVHYHGTISVCWSGSDDIDGSN